MVSRDTRAQLVAVLLALGTIFLVGMTTTSIDRSLEVALAVIVYGVAFGGAHLYLALRHDDGLIPVESRWRYVIALAIVLLSAAAIQLAGGRAVGPTSVETVGLGVIALTAIGYLIAESTAGYRASRAE